MISRCRHVTPLHWCSISRLIDTTGERSRDYCWLPMEEVLMRIMVGRAPRTSCAWLTMSEDDCRWRQDYRWCRHWALSRACHAVATIDYLLIETDRWDGIIWWCRRRCLPPITIIDHVSPPTVSPVFPSSYQNIISWPLSSRFMIFHFRHDAALPSTRQSFPSIFLPSRLPLSVHAPPFRSSPSFRRCFFLPSSPRRPRCPVGMAI